MGGPTDKGEKLAQEPTLPSIEGVVEESRALDPGTTLAGRYEIAHRLGEGGSGHVYAARDRLLGEDVALKILRARFRADGEQLRKLRAEVRAARRITHPNVCRVHDLVDVGGLTFVVMELLEGETLRRRLRRPLALSTAIEIARQLESGLSSAHRAGVIHCDVKPENVILHEPPRGLHLAVTDFGIARLTGSDLPGSDPQVEGTPPYMAPEQLRGRALDERTDVYGLGAVAFELLAGQPPFGRLGGGPVPALVERILHDTPRLPDEALRELAPAVRLQVELVLGHALAKEPAGRYESVAAFFAALTLALGGASSSALALRDVDPLDLTPPAPSRSLHTAAPSLSGKRSRSGRPRGTRRIATVAHIVVQEQATGGEIDDEAADRVEALLATAAQTLADAGGLVVGRAPRAVVAVFGAQTSSGDEPHRAADAARALASGTARASVAVVRAGIDTGRLLVRADGRGDGSSSVAGEALGRAEALAIAAAPGQVRVSARTSRHLARRFVLEPAGDAFAIAARRRAADAQPIVPLVGRDGELERIVKELAGSLREGIPRAALIVGPPGIGKSRLRREIVDVFASSGATQTAVVSAAPDDALASHAIMRRLLRQVLGLADGPAPDEARRAARRALAGDGGGEPNRELVDALAAVLGSRQVSALPGAGGALAAARNAIGQAARARPLLLVVDDAHWADDATLELLESLATGGVEAPVALLVLARPELLERRQRWRRGFGPLVELAPLGAEQALELAGMHLERTSPELVRAIAEASDGNPFFVEELARDLLERGGDGAPAPPSTVEEAIQARLDRLPAEERETLRAAAVLGRTFRRSDLEDLLAAASAADEVALDVGDLDLHLGELEGRRILFSLPQDASADDRYAIKHALIRDVAYRELAPATRRSLHAKAASLLRARAEDAEHEPVEHLIELARHLQGADDAEAAVATYRRAGELAASHDAPADAVRCYGRAIDLATAKGAPADVDLLVRAGEAARLSDLPDAARFLDEAIARIESDPVRRVLLARALLARGHVAMDHARWQDALALLRRGLAVVREEDEPVLAANVHETLGWVLGYALGDLPAGLAECTRAVEILDGSEHLAHLAHALLSLGAVYFRSGRYDEDIRCKLQSIELGEQLGSLFVRARGHLNLGATLNGVGRLEEAIHHSRQAIDLYGRLCSSSSVAVARNNLAAALCDLGRLDDAEREIDEALRLSDRVGSHAIDDEARVITARVAAKRGELDRASELLRGWLEHGGERISEGIVRHRLAAVLSIGGHHDDALRELDAAEKLLEGTDLCELARAHAERFRTVVRAGGDGKAVRAAAAAELARFGCAHDLLHLDDLGWI
jgi:serine/threonine protein kinase/tetratricopeptide (TPR) repeat protein